MKYLAALTFVAALGLASNASAKSLLPLPQLPTLPQLGKLPASASPSANINLNDIIPKVVAWLADDGDKDLDIAIQLATSSKNNVTLPCWQSTKAFVDQVKTLPTPDKMPKLHIATDIEIGSELEITLQPNSPVVASCQGAANQFAMSAQSLITGIVTGALSLSKLAPVIP